MQRIGTAGDFLDDKSHTNLYEQKPKGNQMYNYWKIYTFVLLSFILFGIGVNALSALAMQDVISWEAAQGAAWGVIIVHIGLGVATIYAHVRAKKSAPASSDA